MHGLAEFSAKPPDIYLFWLHNVTPLYWSTTIDFYFYFFIFFTLLPFYNVLSKWETKILNCLSLTIISLWSLWVYISFLISFDCRCLFPFSYLSSWLPLWVLLSLFYLLCLPLSLSPFLFASFESYTSIFIESQGPRKKINFLYFFFLFSESFHLILLFVLFFFRGADSFFLVVHLWLIDLFLFVVGWLIVVCLFSLFVVDLWLGKKIDQIFKIVEVCNYSINLRPSSLIKIETDKLLLIQFQKVHRFSLIGHPTSAELVGLVQKIDRTKPSPLQYIYIAIIFFQQILQ